MIKKAIGFVTIIFAFMLASCSPTNQDTSLLVSLVADGREQNYPQQFPITVGEFLTQTSIVLGPLDEVSPPPFTQITDGMRVTVVRVQQVEECEQSDLPYEERRILNEGLAAGDERIAQPGQNGVEETCNRITIRDGQRMESVPVRTTVIRASQDAVIYYGPTGELDPVQVDGAITYLSNGNIWVIRGSSSNKRVLTVSGDADGRVLSVTPDGQRILFTRSAPPATSDIAFNQLWMFSNTLTQQEPVALRPENVLYADWVPGRENFISYSTAEITANAPGWLAYNDLWLGQVDPSSGEVFNAREFVPRSSGWLLSWWGTGFSWSPAGDQLAWVRADSMGLVDMNTGELVPLLTYPFFNTRQPWSWRANVSWSNEGNLILTTVHGQAIGSESAENSPAFHVAVTAADGAFSTDVVKNAGIWSKPQYSPIRADGTGSIAYLRARDIANSISSSAEYDLIIADRDGSNARVAYPPAGQAGLTADAPYFTWDPSGNQIAIIYGGNLWSIDVISGIAHQLTLDRGATLPIWTR